MALIIKKDHIDKLKLREIIFSNNIEKKTRKIIIPLFRKWIKNFETVNYRKYFSLWCTFNLRNEHRKRYDKILLANCKEKCKEREF